jgi:YVTN family beta-propeller protein
LVTRRAEIVALTFIVLLLFTFPRFGSSAGTVSSSSSVYTIYLPVTAQQESPTALSSAALSSAVSFRDPNASLTVGGVPNGIVLDPSNGNLYVANFGPGTLSVINGSTNSVSATINLNYSVSPWDVGYNPFNGFVYVSETKSGAVSVVNPATDVVVATVAVGDDMLSGDHDDRPIGVVFDPYNDNMYVAMYGSGYLAEINSEKNMLVANAPVGQNAFVNTGLWGLAFNPANCNFYASNEVANTLTVINGASNNLVATISTGRSPNGVAIDTGPGPDFGDVWVTDYAANTVSVFNSSSSALIDTIKVGQNPDGIAFDPISGNFYVTNYGDGTVSVISGSTYAISNTIRVGSGASGITYDPLNGNVYVADSNIGAVSLIPTGDIGNVSTANQTYSPENCNVRVDSTSTTSVTISSTSMLVSSTLSSTSLTQTNSDVSSLSSSSSVSSISNQSSSISTRPVQANGDSFSLELVGVAVIIVVIGVSVFALRSRAKKN